MVATLSLVGVGLGAVSVGPVVDRIGRRWAIIGCVIGFSVFTLLVAFAPNVALFTIYRFIAGLFLGAVMPSALAYISEYNKSGKTGKATTLTMTGYHAGAVAISCSPSPTPTTGICSSSPAESRAWSWFPS